MCQNIHSYDITGKIGTQNGMQTAGMFLQYSFRTVYLQMDDVDVSIGMKASLSVRILSVTSSSRKSPK